MTESRQQGDCKAKSLWLASKMETRNARYVVGKAKVGSQASRTRGCFGRMAARGSSSIQRWRSDVIDADRVAGQKLIAKYSYSGRSAYNHPTYSQYIQN